MPRKFMYVCLGILALLIAYHLGASVARTQESGKPALEARARTFEEEWQQVLKSYPAVARAYMLQQTELLEQHIANNHSLCERIRRGEIFVTKETWEKFCLSTEGLDERDIN